MFPTHLPASALPRLPKDFAALIQKDCEPGTDPLMWLRGCDPEEGHGYLPYGREGNQQELDSSKRIYGGDKLAIRLHTAFVGDDLKLIDRKPYMPLGGHSDDDNEEDEAGDEYHEFPGEMSFYALGVKRDRDKLRIRAVGMNECSTPGGVFHFSGIAEFPASFMARVAAYTGSLK